MSLELAPAPGRERGSGGEGSWPIPLLLLFLAGCAPTRPLGLPAPAALAPAMLQGRFEDDYGNRFVITRAEWVQMPHGRFHVKSWNSAQSYLIAQNDSSNGHAPGKWTRIDWVQLEGMPPWEWAFCLSAYEAPTADSAEATHVAHPEIPRTGCNGYPYSRMKRVAD